MKKLRYIPLLIATVLCISCEDYLERLPEQEYSEGSVWKVEADFDFALNGLYRQLPGFPSNNFGFANNSEFIYTIFTDDAWDRGGKGAVRNADINFTSSSGVIGNEWSRYNVIRDCNELISRAPNAEFSEEIKEQYVAQARFIRAINYARLNFLFGAVPLVTEPTGPTDFPKRATREAVFDFVRSELDAIAQILPESYSGNEIGKITKGAALAFKARHLMNAIDWHSDTNALYQEAKNATETIINSGVYSLDPGADGYARLFTTASEHGNSKESVLTSNYATGTRVHTYNRGMAAKGAYSGSNKHGCYMGISNGLVEAFQMNNGKDVHDKSSGYDDKNPWLDRDPRLDVTVLRAGESIPKKGGNGVDPTYIFDAHPKITPPGGVKTDDVNKATNPTGYNISKYIAYDVVSSTECHIDYKIMRYAEVLLLRAEALLGGDSDISGAIQLVDQVRNRVGMPSVNDSYGAIADVSEALEVILNERRFEFASEGPQRYFDIRRHRLGETVFADPNVYGIPLGKNRKPNKKVKEGDLNDAVKNICGQKLFNAATYYVWPIPQSAIDLNPSLLENPE
ncbi:RagB/SusD family nutrient uptake outer membrane protein [Sediminicola luteus]|uniref:RagB/SusD family nutrient uptake outer membrane protein n=1 Tax=Sediminicola luteus TaxID=319238 RepID=A0A2A4GG42_9FLAO|nr:RagB/SusD family nutrient uptake outer membrane protein [Sediminicola luteus]PCE66702.1 hypothetical protein B7P33_05270 [Sediminicola luteus]